MFGNEFFQRRSIHIALERVSRVEVFCFGAGQVDRVTTDEFDVAAGRIEVRIVRHDRPFLDHDAEQDVFGCASLVCRDNLLEAEDVLDRVTEAIPAASSCVRLVPAHQRTPGLRRHRTRTRIGQ